MATLQRTSTREKLSRNVGFDGGLDPQAVSEADSAGRPARAPPIPASVKINVEGAFIVDDDSTDKDGATNEFVHYEHKDIRLPYHTDVVSHVAVDVGTPFRISRVLLTYSIDWRITGQASILLSRVRFALWRGTTQLPQF